MGDHGTLSPARQQQPDVVKLHSPLELIGAFVYLLREHFKATDLPLTWRDNKTNSDILIESDLNRHTEAFDHKPSIFVSKGQTATQQISIGDRDKYQPLVLKKGLEHYQGILNTDITLHCVSPRKGESTIISDIVMNWVLMSQYAIAKDFAIRDFSPIVQGRTRKFDRDENLFDTPVDFRVQMETRWASIPVAPRLVKISSTLVMLATGEPMPSVEIEQYITGDDNTD